MSKTQKVCVKSIRKPTEARLLYEPMRREILRLLCKVPMTQTQLAKELFLQVPTVGHHLSALKSYDFVRVAHQEPGKHGIVEKYYESTAQLFFVDGRNMSLEIKRYFMPVVIERARGILALATVRKKDFHLPSDMMEEFALAFADNIARIATNYEVPAIDEDPEICINRLYSEALEATLQTGFEELRSALYPDRIALSPAHSNFAQ